MTTSWVEVAVREFEEVTRRTWTPDPRWTTPGALARAIDPNVRQTPALDLIDSALVDVEAGRCDRLIVSMPPQEGKSSRVTTIGPLWFLARNPDRRIAIVSIPEEKPATRMAPRVTPVHASQSKRTRAESIAALYETGKVKHSADGTGRLTLLEAQTLTWTGTGDPPDRIDALVHGLTVRFLPPVLRRRRRDPAHAAAGRGARTLAHHRPLKRRGDCPSRDRRAFRRAARRS